MELPESSFGTSQNYNDFGVLSKAQGVRVWFRKNQKVEGGLGELSSIEEEVQTKSEEKAEATEQTPAETVTVEVSGEGAKFPDPVPFSDLLASIPLPESSVQEYVDKIDCSKKDGKKKKSGAQARKEKQRKNRAAKDAEEKAGEE